MYSNENLPEQSGRDEQAQSRAEDGEWQHQELDLWQQESETGDDGLEYKRTRASNSKFLRQTPGTE